MTSFKTISPLLVHTIDFQQAHDGWIPLHPVQQQLVYMRGSLAETDGAEWPRLRIYCFSSSVSLAARSEHCLFPLLRFSFFPFLSCDTCESGSLIHSDRRLVKTKLPLAGIETIPLCYDSLSSHSPLRISILPMTWSFASFSPLPLPLSLVSDQIE